METIKKDQIREKLRQYCERYESQNKAAASLKGVSSATVSQILNCNYELIRDEMFRNIASQIGFRDDKWEVCETRDFRLIQSILADAKENSLVMAITGDAGSGKTFAMRHFAEKEKRVHMLCCNEYWNRKQFLGELLTSMGRDYSGLTVGEMLMEAVRALKISESPLIILDEADKLSDHVLYFFITLYNYLENKCGIVLCATSFLEKRLKRGLKLNKKGYAEIWSRIGRRCIELKGVGAIDIQNVCEVNGINTMGEIDKVLNDSDGDLRRVRRKIHSLLKSKQSIRQAAVAETVL
jgi:hypothetical protein